MATRSFLKKNNFKKFKEKFESTSFFTGSELHVEKAQAFSQAMSDFLLAELKQFEGWEESCPIALGSWARNEICPNSDIDLLFCGPEDVVFKLVSQLQENNFLIRYRVPENKEDWTQGVAGFDILALLNAQALTDEGQQVLKEQQDAILNSNSQVLRQIFKEMINERKERAQRYDSVSNYLEPNIKYGPGALRDLYQALMITRLFAAKFTEHNEVIKYLNKRKWFYILLRMRLHFYGTSDLLVANFQKEVALWAGYKDLKAFMKKLQTSLSKVSFFTDWVADRAKESERRYDKVKQKKIESYKQILEALKTDDSILVQELVRSRFKSKKYSKLELGDPLEVAGLLNQYINIRSSDQFLISLFRSGLMREIFPHLKKVEGLVQHDQYHKFCVDTHLLQAMRRLKDVYSKPSLFGRLSYLLEDLNNKEWQVLIWTCFFHDLGKGKRSKQGHSLDGAQLSREIMLRFGFWQEDILEISWLVEKHLELSTAAFRHNPKDPSVWKYLAQRGIKGRRLRLLCVFTLIDIHATNPEAWTDWKERLMVELMQTLESSPVSKASELIEQSRANEIDVSVGYLKGLDPTIVEILPLEVLVEEYKSLKNQTMSEQPFLWESENKEVWVRFFNKEDSAGLVFQFLQILFESGCQVQRFFIQTFDDYGVYDWFKVKTRNSFSQFQKKISLLSQVSQKVPLKIVLFDSVRLISETEAERVISFRCAEKNGALISAIQKVSEKGLAIHWARSHTWGRQLEIIVAVYSNEDFEEKFVEVKAESISQDNISDEF